MAPLKKKRRSAGRQAKNSQLRKIVIALAALFLIALASTFFYFYKRIFSPNLVLETGESSWIYIKSTDTFEDVVNELNSKKMLLNQETFIWMARFSDYDKKVKPGRYRIKPGMNNRELVNLLKSGAQEPLRITLQALKYPEQIAGKIGNLLEADSAEIIEKLSDKTFITAFGLSKESALGLFLPDTYTFYWNTPSDSFLQFMGKVYNDFWTPERRKQADELHLNRREVITLASIVQQESNKAEEWPIIAGVYLNRLRRGMKLQADPTVKYAAGMHDMRRVKGILSTDSPYNTYKVHGLPPGPIYLASGKCIDAVLSANSHGFLFFCANPDKAGYHSFAKTWTEHQINARKYWRSLDARGIK